MKSNLFNIAIGILAIALISIATYYADQNVELHKQLDNQSELVNRYEEVLNVVEQDNQDYFIDVLMETDEWYDLQEALGN